MDTPTFYQTLAGVTHLEEQEIVELEKRFWSLASNSSSNQIDISAIRQVYKKHIIIENSKSKLS